MSYKKFYFHCSVSVELKPHMKVLKNLSHNMALKNLYVATILPSYFSIGHKIRTKWMAPNKYCGIFFVHWSGQVLAMFNFSAFDWNYPFWANLVQIIKIVLLS